MTEYKIIIDGNEWNTNSPQSKYDAIHTVAGAILSGANQIEIERVSSIGK